MTARTAFALGLLFLTACSGPGVPGVKTFSHPSGQHQAGLVSSRASPAVGGPHNPSWLNSGVYTSALYPMYVVHSLEHGAVSVTYRSGLPATQIKVLSELLSSRSYTLLSPLAQQSPKIVLSARGAQLAVDDASDPRLNKSFQVGCRGVLNSNRAD